MADFIPLQCPNCAAKLEIYGDMERFACGYCTTEVLVQRRGGTVALRMVTDAIGRVQEGTDRTAGELELVRLERESVESAAVLAKSGPATAQPVGSGCAVIFAGAWVGIGFVFTESYMHSKSWAAATFAAVLTVLGVLFIAAVQYQQRKTQPKAEEKRLEGRRKVVEQQAAQQARISLLKERLKN